MSQEDYDAWAEMDAELEKRNKVIAEFGYYNPLEDIYEQIELIVGDKTFGIFMTYDGNSAPEYKCSECYSSNDPHNIEHDETCRIYKLRSLVNTLGDMIA